MSNNTKQFSCDGKRRYASWTEARKDARKAAKRHNGDQPVLMPYHCTWCCGVHLYSVDQIERGKRLARVEYHDK